MGFEGDESMSERELELKLRLESPDLVPQILDHDEYPDIAEISEVLHTKMEACYYDTPELDLYKKRVSYRVRREGADFTATAKWGGKVSDGLFDRKEINHPVGDFDVGLHSLWNTPLWPVLGDILKGKSLTLLFRTVFDRRSRLLCFQDGTKVELAVDQGEIVTDVRSMHILEVELELKEGDPERVLLLGEVLQAQYPLFPENHSKFQRGLRLAQWL